MTHPVSFVITDDLRRSRLTIFFRLVLVLPHYIWATLWSYAVLPLIAFQWLCALFAGRLEDDVHGFLVRYARYHVHLYAYGFLLADPWPRFQGHKGYPVDLDVAPPERQHRGTVGFRLILALPALIFASVLGTVLVLLAAFGWFAALVLGRMPAGMEELGAYCLRYQTQTYAYLLLLTPRYPTLASGATASVGGLAQRPAVLRNFFSRLDQTIVFLRRGGRGYQSTLPLSRCK